MPKRRSHKSLVSNVKPKQSPPRGLLSAPISSLSLNHARRQAIEALLMAVIMGPPGFPLKPSTGEALFRVALDQLTDHDKNTAVALHVFSGVLARKEYVELHELITAPKDIGDIQRILAFMLEEPASSLNNDVKKLFKEFRRAFGKRTCHPLVLRHQDKLLRTYGRDHCYPGGTRANRARRATWGREHLPAMIARVKGVTCWHPQSDLDGDTRGKMLKSIDKSTSLSKLSASVIAHLHGLSTDYLLKRVLPHSRQ